MGGYVDPSNDAPHDHPHWTYQHVLTIESWRKKYHHDYPFVGRHVGTYYGSAGEELDILRHYEAKLEEAKQVIEIQKEHKHRYPACNKMSTIHVAEVECRWKNRGLSF